MHAQKKARYLLALAEYKNFLVEAAGIEPASESTTLRLLHAYPSY